MKKILLFALFIFLLANVAACGKQEGDLVLPSLEPGAVAKDADDEESVRELIDNTAQFSNSFTVEGKSVIQDMSVAVDFGVIYPDLESVYNGSVNVVVGEVMDVRYTDDESAPRTLYTFAVSETLKGGIVENSLISISESNGYVRLVTVVEAYGVIPYEGITDEEIENGVVLQSLGGAPLPKAGDQCVVFLGEQKQEGRIAGAYAVIGNFMGKYVLDQDTNLYSRFCPSENPELYSVYDPVTKAATKEEPMPLSTIREEILSYQ